MSSLPMGLRGEFWPTGNESALQLRNGLATVRLSLTMLELCERPSGSKHRRGSYCLYLPKLTDTVINLYFIDEGRNSNPLMQGAPPTTLILSAALLPAVLELFPAFCGVRLT